MTITITPRHMLRVLYVLSWIIFIGLSIEAGGFISNTILSLSKPATAAHLWWQVDLLPLLKHDRGQFLVLMIVICIVAIAKATMFYQIIKIMHDKKVNISQPFNITLVRLIQLIAYLALLISLFSWCGINYADWLTKNGATLPDAQHLRFAGADIWLFMSVALLVIAQIFKKGIEIQTENELTV